MRETGIILLAILAFGVSAHAEDYYYYYFKEKVPLTLDENAIFVVNHDQRPANAVENYLQAVGMRDFRAEPFIKNSLIFLRDTPSADSRSIPEIIAEISERPDNPFFLGPVFRFPSGGRAVVPPTVMLRFNKDISFTIAEQMVDTMGNSDILKENYGGISRSYLIKPRTKSGFVALTTANRLAEQPEIQLGDPGLVFAATPSSCASIPGTSGVDEPNDNDLSWALFNSADYEKGTGDSAIDVDAKEAWETCGGNSSVSLAVLDVGSDKNHEDLQVAVGVDCTATFATSICKCDTVGYCDPSNYDATAGSPIFPGETHGTMVAGVAAARINNFVGSAGLAPNLSLVSIRAFYNGGWDSRDIVAALEWARLHSVRVISISFNSKDAKSAEESTAYTEAREAGIVIVASAANNNQNEVYWPANLDPVIGVSALDRTGSLWVKTPGVEGSNYGPQIMIAAPGDGIFSTDRMGLANGYSAGCTASGDMCCVPSTDPGSPDPKYCCTADGNYCTLSGTSFAAPLVAATAGMILSVNPDLASDQVEWILCESAQPFPIGENPDFYGCGILDADAAVNLAVESLTWLIFEDGFDSGNTAAWSAVVSN